MLKAHKRRQQAARRGETRVGWKLYETEAGKVPKDLAEMFSGIKRSEQVIRRPKVPVLTTAENAVLDKSLRFIERHGISNFARVSNEDGAVPPTIERIAGAKGPLVEMKINSAAHNPRFIFVDCHGVAVFLDAFKKKEQKLARKDIARSDDRYTDLRTRGEC